MQKRRIEITTRPTYICTNQGTKIFLREVPQEPEEEVGPTPMKDFVTMFVPASILLGGAVMGTICVMAGIMGLAL